MPLSDKQILSFNEANKRLNVWIGAVRSGKTYSSILKFVDLLKNGPEGSCMIIGVNRDTIQRNVLLELYKFLGFPCPGTKTTETKLYGRNVYFVGAHDEGSVRRIQGSTLAFAYVDEVTCIPQPFFTMLLSRLSVRGAQLLCTGNPEGPAHWFKKNYIDRQHELDMAHWHFTLDDNPSLDPAYVENLKKEYTGAWYQRLILGLWVANSGLIYDRFDDLNLYTQPRSNPDYYVMGIDYGTSDATAAVICAVTPHVWPQISVIDEFYYDSRKSGRQLTDDELGDRLMEFIGCKNLRGLYVDPSAASLKVELRRRNLPVLDAKNDVIPGIRTTAKFIAGKNLVVHKACTVMIEELQSYLWDSKASDKGYDKPLHEHSHICVIGSTLVVTENGEIPIKDLVGKSGFLYSYSIPLDVIERDEFYNVCKTKDDAEIWELELESGRVLRSTGDHCIYTQRGWVMMKDLTEKDEILTENINGLTEESLSSKSLDIGIQPVLLK